MEKSGDSEAPESRVCCRTSRTRRSTGRGKSPCRSILNIEYSTPSTPYDVFPASLSPARSTPDARRRRFYPSHVGRHVNGVKPAETANVVIPDGYLQE